MIDIHTLRQNPDLVRQALDARNAPLESYSVLDAAIKLDSQWRNTKKEEEELRAERNKLSMEINEKKKKGENADDQILRSGTISKRIKEITLETDAFMEQIKNILLTVPNLPHQSVPKGNDASSNKIVRKVGEPKKKSSDILPHYELSSKIDFERGVKLAHHRFSVLYGDLSKLERALINFMLSSHTSNGYLEVSPPYLVNTKTMTGTGQLPKFSEDLYKCDEDLWLIPTAEVPLTNIYSDEVLDSSSLPINLTAYTPCFRKEAGAYGKDIKGLIRQHQFNKVELVKFVHPENSFEELEKLTSDAEGILKSLDLPYQVIELCTGDMGFASAKTYDLEVWLPSQDCYREISSCSNCTDFQARRANIRFKDPSSKSNEFVHTLNGSGLAVGRTMVAILENFQEDKNTVVVPKVLRDFMGKDTISV